MRKDYLGKRKKKLAAALSSLMLLGFSPALPEGYLSAASALTIVHERPRQQGSGEFRRLTPSQRGKISEEYVESGEVSGTGELNEISGISGVNGAAEALPEEKIPAADDFDDEDETDTDVDTETEDEPEESDRPEEDGEEEPVEEEKPVEPVKSMEPVEAVGESEPKAQTTQKEKEEKPGTLAAILEKTAQEAEAKPAVPRGGQKRLPENKKPAISAAAREIHDPLPEMKPGAVAKTKKMNLWPMASQDVGGTLLLSDNPEYVRKPGIHYREQIKGDARVLYYHVNETGKDLRIAILLENKGKTQAAVHVTRLGLVKPSPDYLAVGKAVQLSYFGSQAASGFVLEPGERRILCPEQADQLIKPEDLACSCVDFTASHPVTATILAYEAAEDPLEYLEEAPLIKATDDKLRGSFTGMNRLLTGKKEYRPRKDGIVYFTIGDRKTDTFHSGIDAADGTIMTNEGNYGIVYNVTIPCAGGGFRAYLAPRGGVYAGAVNVETDENVGSPRLVETPTWSGWNFGTAELLPDSYEDKKGKCRISPQDEVTLLGSFAPRRELRLELSPPPASNLPVRIILVPEEIEPLASEEKRR